TDNFQGMIDVVHRKYCMTARQAIQQFGEENLPQQVRTTAKSDPSKQFNFLHRVEPNDKRDMSRRDKEGMPFRSVHICMEGSKIVQEGGYWSQPYAISRYYTAPGEVYGRSPAMVVLPDIKLLNEINRAIIEGAQMAVRPPMLLPEDGILQPFKMMPGALNFGGMNRDGKPLAVPLNTATDFSVAMTLAEQKRQTINDGFFITLFQILVDNPQMTATEAMLRAQEKGQLLAPTAGRIQAEFLGTLILREIDIAYQNGLLPEPPEQLKEIGGEYDIEYTSPLVRLQMSEEASGIMNVINAAGTIGQFDQNIARTLNGDAALRFIAKASGAPLQVVKTEDEMAAQDAADQQQLQLQQLLAAAPVAATAAKDFAQANQIAQTPAPSPALQG
ncbi:TPA: phage head-tail adapter protein, partial [Klebsiella pneumoniae]|nr:phage head-tail adapter protein [Klebsiella pneumoniae]